MKTTFRMRGDWVLALAIIGLTSVSGCSSSTTPGGSGGSGGKDAAAGSGGGHAGGGSGGMDAAADFSDGNAGGAAGSDAATSDADGATGSTEILYANSGLTLNTFGFNPADGTLAPKSSMALPQTLQFADFDSKFQHLYAGVGAAAETAFTLHGYSIDPQSGGLSELAAPADAGTADAGTADAGTADAGTADAGTADGGTAGVVSPNGRVINLTLSRDDRFLLAVHNVTKSYTVFQLNADGSIGARVPQAAGTDTNVGAFVHQIRIDPSNKYATICDRGNDPVYGADGGVTKPEDVGHLLVFTYAAGVLTPLQTITFPTGLGPRHLDFHPSKPWVYLSVERGNRLIMYSVDNGMLTEKFNVTSVAAAADSQVTNATEAVNGQRAGAIKVHSSGKFLWITNRNYATVAYAPDGGASDGGDGGSDASPSDGGASDASDAGPPAPPQVFAGTGENNIALFSIDQVTGEPTLVSATDSHGFEPRTLTLDPSGKFMIVGNQKKVTTVTASGLVPVLPNLAVFGVAQDGKLTFLKSYDQTSGEVWWVGGPAVGH